MTIFSQTIRTEVGFTEGMADCNRPVSGAQIVNGRNQRSASMEIQSGILAKKNRTQ